MAGGEYGHIKISRKAYKSTAEGGDKFWNEPREFSRWEAWEWMIQAAAWRDHTRVIGLTEIPLRRGEFLASVRYLAEAWGWSVKRVRNWLKLVTDTDRIRAQRETHVGTVYLLENYDEYQSTPTERAQRGADKGHSRGTAGAQQGHKGEAGKAIRIERERKRTSALPDDWQPNDAHREFATERGVDVTEEAASFRDHAKANGRTQLDWDAAFRNWLRKAYPRKAPLQVVRGGRTPQEEKPWWEIEEEKFGPQRTGTDQ